MLGSADQSGDFGVRIQPCGGIDGGDFRCGFCLSTVNDFI